MVTRKTKQLINLKTVDTPSDLAKINDRQLGLFNYSSLSADTAKLAKESAIEIKAREKAIWENIIEIGNKLIEVKNALPHGQFESWVKQEFKWSKMTASKYIKVAKEIEPKVKDSLLLPNSLEGLYQLASGLSKADEETKEEILTAVEEKTEEKGKALTEKEIKEITASYLKEIEALKKKQEQLTLEIESKDTRIDNIKSHFLTQLDTKEKELNKSKETLENQHKQIQELNSLTSGLEKRQHDLAEKEQLIADQFANLSSIIDNEVDVKLKKEKSIVLAELEEQKIALKTEQGKIKKELEEVEREKNHLSKNTAWLDLITEFNLEFAKMSDRLKYISHELNKIPNVEDLGELSDTAKQLRSIQMEKFSDNLEEFGKYNNRIVMSISRIDKNPLKAYEVSAEVIDD